MSDETTNHGIPAPEGTAVIIETEYEIGQDNLDGSVGPFGFDIHNPVFAISGAAIVAFVFFTLALPEQADTIFKGMFNFATKNFDWFLIGAADIVLIFALFLIISPFGSIRLGGSKSVPDYTYVGWFSILFASAMGLGLMVYGVS